MRDCNFIPASYREEQSLRLAVKRRAVCVLLLMVAMGMWWLVHQGRVASARAILVETQMQLEQLDIHLQRKSAMDAEEAELTSRRALLAALDSGPSAPRLFSEISERMPPSILLTYFSFSTDGRQASRPPLESGSGSPTSTLTGSTVSASANANAALPAVIREDQKDSANGAVAPISGPAIFLNGLSANTTEIIQFAASLEGCPMISRVHLRVTGPVVWSGRKAEQFEITCHLADGSVDHCDDSANRFAWGRNQESAR